MSKFITFLKALGVGLLSGLGFIILGFNLLIFIDYIAVSIVILAIGVIISYVITVYYYRRLKN